MGSITTLGSVALASGVIASDLVVRPIGPLHGEALVAFTVLAEPQGPELAGR